MFSLYTTMVGCIQVTGVLSNAYRQVYIIICMSIYIYIYLFIYLFKSDMKYKCSKYINENYKRIN